MLVFCLSLPFPGRGAAQSGSAGISPLGGPPLHRKVITDDNELTIAEFGGKVLGEAGAYQGSASARARVLASSRNKRVIKHLRSSVGPYSVPFPDAEAVESSQMPIKLQRSSLREVTVAEHLPGFQLGIPPRPGMTDLSSLSECRTPRTIQSPVSSESTGQSGVLYDALFLRREDMPKDPDLAFGRIPSLYFYDKDRIPLTYHFAAANGMDCLPFRIVVTGKIRYLMYGSDALGNYSQLGQAGDKTDG